MYEDGYANDGRLAEEWMDTAREHNRKLREYEQRQQHEIQMILDLYKKEPTEFDGDIADMKAAEVAA